MSNFKSIEEAREFLIENGFCPGNLWSVQDVIKHYDCTEDEAMGVLESALEDDTTMEQIWSSIDIHAQEEGLTRK